MFTVEKAKPKTFDFQLEGSKKTYHVPVMSALPLGIVSKAKDFQGDEIDEIEALEYIKGIFDEYAPGVVDGLNAEQFAILFQAYTEASGATLGE